MMNKQYYISPDTLIIGYEMVDILTTSIQFNMEDGLVDDGNVYDLEF